MLWKFWITTLLLLSIFSVVRITVAGGGPHNVALVVNPDDPDSLAIANYYIELRQIPASNVIYIPWRVDIHAATGVQFRDRLLKPVLKHLKDNGLAAQVDYLAFSSGYPYLIDCTALFPGQEFPKQFRPATSLTSAAFFYQFMLNGQLEMFGMTAHEYFAPTVGGATASRAFSAFQPPPGGAPASAVEKKYLLSTALGVTHGHGNAGGEITSALRRAKQADGTRPKGAIYYMQNNNIRSKVRAGEFAGAVRELAAVGVKAVVLPGVVPTNKPDVAGLTTGAPHVKLDTSGSTLLPGALVDNLTSAGGQMLLRQESNPQTRISEYIRLGAAGVSGTVVEPFAIPQKFPSAALHVHYARGCSLAEAYYQSVAAPFHLLIIGDPLCAPWASTPSVGVSGGTEAEQLSGTVAFTPWATFSSPQRASRFELYLDGVRNQSISPANSFSLDTTALADGWHELRVVAIGDTPIEVQGAWIEPVQVRNGTDKLELRHDEPIRAAIGSTVTLDVASTQGSEAVIMQNGRRVGAATGGSARVELDANLLGKGRTVVHAEQEGAVRLRSNPVTIEVN